MSTTKKLWLGLAALLIASFAVMLWLGADLHQTAPPIPKRVVAANGQVLYTQADIDKGRQVWQTTGGQQLGSIWGHGALIAPDWSADWLHREAMALAELDARAETAEPYASLDEAGQARINARIKPEMRTNTYDPATGDITVSNARAWPCRALATWAAPQASCLPKPVPRWWPCRTTPAPFTTPAGWMCPPCWPM